MTAQIKMPLRGQVLALALMLIVRGWLPCRALAQAQAPENSAASSHDSRSCLHCHQGIESMHRDGDSEIGLTCVGCHGGNGQAFEKKRAHVQPRLHQVFKTSANPRNSYAALNQESEAFIRFMNPGDFRVAGKTCGKCHYEIYTRMMTSIMAHNAMIPQAGLYNNGIHDARKPVFGEAYLSDGSPAILKTQKRISQPSQVQGAPTSLVNKLEPLPRFEMIPATDAFRVLERGNNDAGTRGPGTDFHVAGGGIVLHKTRLNDPTLWFLGTNQAAGDFRSSGCSACHVLYANERQPLHGGPLVAKFFNKGGKPGHSGSADHAIPKNEPGHPVKHRLSLAIPVAQCLTCHHHQGNGALGNYVGILWWDQETDARLILNEKEPRDKLISEKKRDVLYRAGKVFRDVQFADLHGHSWNFRKVYKRDRKGRLLDANDKPIANDDPQRFKKAVHLVDIHFEKGMHCIDCHTEQDVHGDGQLWGAMNDPIEIRCVDCHGTLTQRATLVTSGLTGGRNLADRRTGPRTPFGQRQFQIKNGQIIQHSKIYKNLKWVIPQLVDIVNPNSPRYNPRAARAKTLLRNGRTWGKLIADARQLAHPMDEMECYTCHSAWNTGCYGCHLDVEINQKEQSIHYEGEPTRARVTYNPQVVRSDALLLGINSSSKGNKFSPFRSASAVTVTARDRGRNVVVHQQQTISAGGYSGFAFSPNVPHTVRKKETRRCSDCHISAENDNNAWLASLLGMGTNAVNFIGEYAYVAVGKKGIQAVKVTEGREPQPVIGSRFHRLLHPRAYRKFVRRNRRLKTAYRADSKNALGIAARGEFVFVADGPGGFKVYDRANIANKARAQRLVENQNSRFGQRTRVKTRFATAIALPNSVPMNPNRPQRPENLEKPIAPLFRYAYVADREEGLILVDVTTLDDGDPRNNFLQRAVTYNPGGRLRGAVDVQVAGNYIYLMSEITGFNVVKISQPATPQFVANLGAPQVVGARAVNIQFRYAFVVDREGFKVIDMTEPENPRRVRGAFIPFAEARDVYTVRTYAYVAAGSEGLAIIDIERPEHPVLVEKYSAGGQINDAYAVTTGTINASTFAFVADGRNGLRIISLIEPGRTPGHLGFSPRPVPALIATFKTSGPALAIADGARRDRAVDEDGNQIGVAGRLGSHPLRKQDMDRLLRRQGKIFTVRDTEPAVSRARSGPPFSKKE